MIGLVLLITLCSYAHAQESSLVSPNGETRISVQTLNSSGKEYGSACFTVEYLNAGTSKTILHNAKLGIKTENQDFSDNIRLISVSERKTIDETYPMITGKRSVCSNKASERVYRFENDKKRTMDVTFRAYNDGVTFRYSIHAINDGTEQITEELTTYPIANGKNRWIQSYDPGYERFYPLATTGVSTSHRNANMWGYPALVETDNSVFMLITEANIQRGHCGSRLKNENNSDQYRVNLADEKLPFSGTWTSPWRVLIIGSLAGIVESTLVTDVSEPAKIKDTGWIAPGPVSWIYWAYNHGSKDFQIVKQYIDLAVEMKWPYTLIDWEWDQMSNGGTVEDAIKYSLNKGIKPLLWYNSGTSWIGPGAPEPQDRLNSKENREKEYTWLKKNGIAGIKVDFFKGDDAGSMNYYIDLLEDALKNKLMINFHGATIPRGWQRTYPHLMTVEGVYGAEWYNNAPVLTNRAASHNTTLPFTRNVTGSMDYTPGTFSDSQHPHVTTHGHELALCIAFESSLQHMPDRPSSYLSLPEPVKSFLSGLPTAWDDTKLLSGYPGKEVIIARRKGNTWYIAGLNGTDLACKLSFTPDRFGITGKTMTIFKDGDDDRSFNMNLNTPMIDSKAAVEIECLPRGGFVAIIK